MLNKIVNLRLSEAEDKALLIWANNECIENRSLMMRRIIRLALRDHAPREIFPPNILKELRITGKARS